MTRKALISPGFGAGWSTWAYNDAMKRDMVFDPALIAAVEQEGPGIAEDHPAVVDFVQRMIAKYGEDEGHMYLGGLASVVVIEVEGEFLIEEYGGFESIRERDKGEWF